MILTCPKCATRFFTDEGAIGPVGRKVRCDACNDVWTAFRPRQAFAEPLSAKPAPQPAPAPFPSSLKSISEPASVSESEAPTPLFTQRPLGGSGKSASPSSQRNRTLRLTLLAVLILVLAAVVAALVFHRAIVATLPWTAPIYKPLGIASFGA